MHGTKADTFSTKDDDLVKRLPRCPIKLKRHPPSQEVLWGEYGMRLGIKQTESFVPLEEMLPPKQDLLPKQHSLPLRLEVTLSIMTNYPVALTMSPRERPGRQRKGLEKKHLVVIVTQWNSGALMSNRASHVWGRITPVWDSDLIRTVRLSPWDELGREAWNLRDV